MVVWPHTDSASSSPSSSHRRLCPQVLHPLSSRGASNLSLRLCFAFACWFTKRGKVGVKLPQYQSGFANDDCMEWLPHFASKRRLLPPPRPIAPICFWRVRGVGAGLHVRHTQTARHTHTTVPIHQADILYSLFPPGLPSGKQQSTPGKFSVPVFLFLRTQLGHHRHSQHVVLLFAVSFSAASMVSGVRGRANRRGIRRREW